MVVKEFIETIYHGLTQRGATMFVSKESLLNYINYGLNDIYSFEGRGWSFMYRDDETITIPTTLDTFYIHTTQFPIFRLINMYDNNKAVYLEKPRFRQIKNNIKDSGEMYYIPFTTALTTYNNTDGYILSYLGWFNNVTKDTDNLPIPNAFTHALYDFVMSYILPVYAQYGEMRENVSYQKGIAKLNELKKADDIQFNLITFNIK